MPPTATSPAWARTPPCALDGARGQMAANGRGFTLKSSHTWRRRLAAAGLVGTVGVVAAVTPVLAASGGNGSLQTHRALHAEKGAAQGQDEIVQGAVEYAASRVAPGTTVNSGAFVAAFKAGAALPQTGAGWSQLTTQPYDSDAFNYRDPVISNSGGGAGIVSGRMTGIAVDPSNPALVFAGAADGGVWK